ncbi:hypothetical protein C2G38_2292258 [Gigaspora rosea]|uniref:Uncharacterized protein n=1 Tax=Gigaspora rosea TaxID=44941 RepID=A0A397U544_9GLOM|nr:hypothetical protein C2G38_2292258 [Gigaspora rosea]
MYKKKGKRTNTDTSLNFNTLKCPKQLDDQDVKSNERRTSISSKPIPSTSASTSSVTTSTSVASAAIASFTSASSRLASSTSLSSTSTLSTITMSQNRKRKEKGYIILYNLVLGYCFKGTQDTADSRIINKVLNVMQNNSAQLKQLSRDHARLEFLIREQQTQLGEVLKKFEIIDEFDNVKKGKGKKPSKNPADICFQNAARKLAHELFHSHVQISNERIKEQLKKMLESDEECTEQLQKLNDKGVLFNIFWNDKLSSEVVSRGIACHLYSNFKGILYPCVGFRSQSGSIEVNFGNENFKYSDACSNLAKKSNPDNPNSNTFLSLIIKYVFVSDEEYTQANAIWTQAVLETIFDEEYLLPKIDADVVDVWIQKLNVEEYCFAKRFCKFSCNNELSSGDGNENDHKSDSNYEE